jgi:aminoglycoside 6'-N-acetyltransferase
VVSEAPGSADGTVSGSADGTAPGSADGAGLAPVHEAIEPLDGVYVHLRPATAADRDALVGVIADPSVARWWQTEDAEDDVAEMLGDDELALWMIEADGRVIGLIQAVEETEPQYRHASIDIAIVEAGQGRGLGPDAVRTVARWLIDIRGHHRLTIDPSTENERAIRTYARVGFRPVGVLREYERWLDGAWHDGLLMDLVAADLVR